MFDSILQKDKQLSVFLNNLGSEQWDFFWLEITNQFHWTPLFIFILVLIFKKFGLKNGLLLLLFIAIMITFSDQFTNFIKNHFERLRPCNTPSLVDKLRIFRYRPGGFSFFSGHAFVSTTIMTFLILLFRKHYKWIYFLVLFPLIFGYSRIYLGVHFPLDIATGYILGIILGTLFYKLLKLLKPTI